MRIRIERLCHGTVAVNMGGTLFIFDIRRLRKEWSDVPQLLDALRRAARGDVVILEPFGE